MPPQSVGILTHYAHKRYNHNENCGGDGSDEDVNGNIKTGTAINPKGPRNQKHPAHYPKLNSILGL